jgi:type I restriction enzyme R subunit
MIDQSAAHLRIDERNHVERPLLDQLAGLGWEVLDLGMKQEPRQSFRESFTEVVMGPVLREHLRAFSPWPVTQTIHG